MALFKSKEERRIERNIQVRRALSRLRRQVKENEKHETGYVARGEFDVQPFFEFPDSSHHPVGL